MANNYTQVYNMTTPSPTNGSDLEACFKMTPHWANMFRPLDDPDYPWLGLWTTLPIMGVWYWCTDQVEYEFLACNWGAYNLTEKSSWGVRSMMVHNLPAYCRIATSVTIWIQKRGKFVLAWVWNQEIIGKLVSNILFGSYQPEWMEYFKTYSLIFFWNFLKVTLPFTFHPEFPKFSVMW